MNRHLNEKGFTLVELLVALTLMAIGILAVVQMQVVGMKTSSIANNLSVATGLANEVMEDIQSWDLNTPPVVNLFDPPAPAYTLGNQVYDRFQGARNVNSITIPSAGTFMATYNVTLVQNAGQSDDLSTAIITVNLCANESNANADIRCGNVAGRRLKVALTSHRRVR